MNEVTVGALFKAFQIVNRRREKAIIDGDDYGRAFVASCKLEEILTGCNIKVVLPPDVIAVVVPLLSVP